MIGDEDGGKAGGDDDERSGEDKQEVNVGTGGRPQGGRPQSEQKPDDPGQHPPSQDDKEGPSESSRPGPHSFPDEAVEEDKSA